MVLAVAWRWFYGQSMWHTAKKPTMKTSIDITQPDWLQEKIGTRPTLCDDVTRMDFVLTLAEETVTRRYGGPFAAAVFSGNGELVAVGVNSVLPQHNSILHAEVVALMFAQQQWQQHALPQHTLFSSCAPCAMCLGAIFWSGVSRVVSAATKADAEATGFDEGPVFPQTLEYLREAGIELVEGLQRQRAKQILLDYRAGGGDIYNPLSAKI